MMAQDGQIRADMSVTDYLQKIGIDPAGPVTQLSEWLNREKQKADPAQKMRRIAAPSGQPQATPNPAMQGGSFGDLLR